MSRNLIYRRSTSRDSGMSLLELLMAVMFLGMFTAALLASTVGINRLTRGFTCRILSATPGALSPERGCMGQTDEVSSSGLDVLRVANLSALKSLRNDLIRAFALQPDNISNQLSISHIDIVNRSLSDRHNVQAQRCLWEKLSPISTKSFEVVRNTWAISSDGSVQVLAALPPLRDRLPDVHYWFLRSGRLLGETMSGSSSLKAQPVHGVLAVNDDFLTVRASSSITEIEITERSQKNDLLQGAPDQHWGFLNQICLYQSPSLDSITSSDKSSLLYLLSADSGHDLPASAAPYFGRYINYSIRQSLPRLVFVAPQKSSG